MVNRSTHVLILGTNNRKKGMEIQVLLKPLGIQVRTLAQVSNAIEVEETGSTFAENASLKATDQAINLKHWVLGEDSGLVVDALKGAPGIYSARFSGTAASDEQNNKKLLEELRNVPPEKRAAHYVCHCALADPDGNIRAETEGQCHGRICLEEAGSGGFGYDPLFEIVEYHRTFAELGSVVKTALSHRARAMRQLLPKLRELITSGEWS